ncbi:hypothetical protein D9611_009658 [Ephemerocybe angulata]|uniref:Uncharacterized protein n=1 Tax=Ephemerocybe angulata TaxID=980116 RepID=A0A8H5C6X9_9AGAR|nr:hypothetical protein D9611_009658 [Tulosesus angulatus]
MTDSVQEVEAQTAKQTFDPEHKLVTSWAFSPTILAGLRLFFAFFTLFTAIFTLVWPAVRVKDGSASGYFSYFTNLTFIGICAYFFASGVQTYAYAKSSRNGDLEPTFPLQRWGRVLQYLHVLLYTTIVTFPILVTIVYWALLASSESFETPYTSYSNIVKHALNSAFALFEIIFTNVGLLPWLNLPVTIVILAGYVGVAYITHETQGFYPYAFLNPKKQGAKLAGYIVGIAVGEAIIFVIVWAIIKLREFIVLKKRSKKEVKA